MRTRLHWWQTLRLCSTRSGSNQATLTHSDFCGGLKVTFNKNQRSTRGSCTCLVQPHRPVVYYCAGYALRKVAEDNLQDGNEEAIKTITENFYVDDCLKSVDSKEEAIRLTSQLREILQEGGFRLNKWIINDSEVLRSIPESERAASVVDLELHDLPIERTLGVLWDVQNDNLGFRTTAKNNPTMRRGVLSTVSSIYDPFDTTQSMHSHVMGEGISRVWGEKFHHSLPKCLYLLIRLNKGPLMGAMRVSLWMYAGYHGSLFNWRWWRTVKLILHTLFYSKFTFGNGV